MKGDIRDGVYAGRAKEYSWAAMREVFGGNITPQDIDGTVEKNRCFWFFEGKTEGAELPQGQHLYIKHLLLSLPEGCAVYVIGTHPELDRVDHTAFTDVRIVWRKGFGVVQKTMPQFGSMMWHCAEMFTRDAKAGTLDPAGWFSEWERMCAPFEDDAA